MIVAYYIDVLLIFGCEIKLYMAVISKKYLKYIGF